MLIYSYVNCAFSPTSALSRRRSLFLKPVLVIGDLYLRDAAAALSIKHEQVLKRLAIFPPVRPEIPLVR